MRRRPRLGKSSRPIVMPRARSSAAVLVALRDDPESVPLHEELLWAYAGENQWGSQARADCILWLVANDPTNIECRTPLAHVDPGLVPEAYAAIRQAWMEHVSASDADPDVLRGAAFFVAAEEPLESLSLLRRATELRPTDPELWVDIARLSRDADTRLAAFLEARARGSRHPNLIAGTALAAAAAGDFTAAESLGHELLELVSEARREHGDKLDWHEEGQELWTRARSNSVDDATARRLTAAIAAHAYHKHHAHTVLGLVAAQRNDLTAAAEHLQRSTEIQADHRLRANGPCPDLLRVVCTAGGWADAEKFLRTWAAAWPCDHVDTWLVQVSRREVPTGC
jgi:hypothetical protein